MAVLGTSGNLGHRCAVCAMLRQCGISHRYPWRQAFRDPAVQSSLWTAVAADSPRRLGPWTARAPRARGAALAWRRWLPRLLVDLEVLVVLLDLLLDVSPWATLPCCPPAWRTTSSSISPVRRQSLPAGAPTARIVEVVQREVLVEAPVTTSVHAIAPAKKTSSRSVLLPRSVGKGLRGSSCSSGSHLANCGRLAAVSPQLEVKEASARRCPEVLLG